MNGWMDGCLQRPPCPVLRTLLTSLLPSSSSHTHHVPLPPFTFLRIWVIYPPASVMGRLTCLPMIEMPTIVPGRTVREQGERERAGEASSCAFSGGPTPPGPGGALGKPWRVRCPVKQGSRPRQLPAFVHRACGQVQRPPNTGHCWVGRMPSEEVGRCCPLAEKHAEVCVVGVTCAR